MHQKRLGTTGLENGHWSITNRRSGMVILEMGVIWGLFGRLGISPCAVYF